MGKNEYPDNLVRCKSNRRRYVATVILIIVIVAAFGSIGYMTATGYLQWNSIDINAINNELNVNAYERIQRDMQEIDRQASRTDRYWWQYGPAGPP